MGYLQLQETADPAKKGLTKGGCISTREELLRQAYSQPGLATEGLSISLFPYSWLFGGDSLHSLKTTKAIPDITCSA